MRLTVRIVSSASPESRLPRLAPPSTSSPMPVARRRSISAQSAGEEQAISRPVSFSTQRNAGMSSLEPSRMPGLAGAGLRREVGLPLGEPVAVLGDPAGHRRRAAVAHRVAQHGQRQPVDLEEEDPRARRVVSLAPWRRAMRRVTRQGVLVVVVRPQDRLQDEARPRPSPATPAARRRTSRRGCRRAAAACAASSSPASAKSTSRKPVDEHEREPQRREDRWQHAR